MALRLPIPASAGAGRPRSSRSGRNWNSGSRPDRSRRCGDARARPVRLEPVRHSPEGATEIEVVGQQWQWSFRLPGERGELGTSDPQFVSADNPLGLNPNDPESKDNIVIDRRRHPSAVGKPVQFLLRSIDVVHDFWVPEFRAKMDLMPGLVTRFWLTPTRTGTFEILCAGFCGIGHPQMRGNRRGGRRGRLPGLAQASRKPSPNWRQPRIRRQTERNRPQRIPAGIAQTRRS